MTPILLDTCAAIWVSGGHPLTNESFEALARARRASVPICVSPITAWEIGLLNSKGRLPLLMEPSLWFDRLMGLPGLELASLTPEMLVRSSFLPGEPPRDPGDRIIAATARTLGCQVMTRDRRLLAYADAGHLDAISC